MTEAGQGTLWIRVTTIDTDTLADARLQLHHAAQLIVSAPISYLPARADDSHTNLEWRPALRALVTNALPPSGLRFGLRPHDLSLLELADGETPARVFALDGRAGADALAWMREALGRAGLAAASLTTTKHYEIPPHAVATGGRYALHEATGAVLSAWYHDAWVIASAVAAREAGASQPRCWPHHFDLATLITLSPAADGSTRTIGVGMTPGDESYPAPYFYVGPYPWPSADALPRLGAGHWHTQGWIGAVLTTDDILGEDAASGQEALTMAFVDAAVAASRQILGA